jgi:16S rRNA (guanine1207-N2)-methyltransferase
VERKEAVKNMSEHYYSEKPTVKSNPKTWSYMLKNHELRFTSDHGVFSKDTIDFGTRLLIETFKFPETEGDILDVGCGYGPVGISLAKTEPSRKIKMVDVNERAVELSKQNAKANHVTNVEALQSNLFENVSKTGYAAILSNPPIRTGKKLVHKLLEEAYHFLVSNGELWIVIQKKQGAPSAKEKLESLFDEVDIIEKSKGYFIIRAKKY